MAKVVSQYTVILSLIFKAHNILNQIAFPWVVQKSGSQRITYSQGNARVVYNGNRIE